MPSSSPAPDSRPNPSIFAAFGIPSFRFQFGADMLVAWAIEMEVIILAWYVLTETNSAVLLGIFGALRFGGTLISPLLGSMADGSSRKKMLVAIRATFAVLALLLMTSALTGWLATWQVFLVATLTGLLRPADMMLRQSVIADAVPREYLANAIGFSRTTLDSARIVGALAGAGLMSWIGLGEAYIVVAGFYTISTLLSLRITDVSTGGRANPARALQDLVAGWRYLREAPDIRCILFVAFLVNLTLLSISGGLLPLVAKNIYGLPATGLGVMVASFAGGALIGSLIIATALQTVRAERLMLGSTLLWHALMFGFAYIEDPNWGIPMLGLIGFVSSFSMVPMASALMLAIPVSFRARIMGLRQLAVFGLPLGLLFSGPLIEWQGIAATFGLYAAVGLLATLWIGWHWRRLAGSAFAAD